MEDKREYCFRRVIFLSRQQKSSHNLIGARMTLRTNRIDKENALNNGLNCSTPFCLIDFILKIRTRFYHILEACTSYKASYKA